MRINSEDLVALKHLQEDMNVIDEMQKQYYKLYFKTKKEEKNET